MDIITIALGVIVALVALFVLYILLSGLGMIAFVMMGRFRNRRVRRKGIAKDEEVRQKWEEHFQKKAEIALSKSENQGK